MLAPGCDDDARQGWGWRHRFRLNGVVDRFLEQAKLATERRDRTQWIPGEALFASSTGVE